MITLGDLLRRVPAEVEDKVRKTRDQARPVLQEAMRMECRLQFRNKVSSAKKWESVQVPVEIAPGMPEEMEDIEFPDDLDLILLLSRNRTTLEQCAEALPLLIELKSAIKANEKWLQKIPPIGEEPEKTSQWVTHLLEILNRQDPVDRIFAVDDDILGVYKYVVNRSITDDRQPNKAWIILYWGIIGLTSEMMGCDVEDLTIVVLAHELAHAYTQLGADTDDRRWLASAFCDADRHIKEGLAQYYTHRVLNRLDEKYQGALLVFNRMWPHQPPPYRAHDPWTKKYAPETVRRAMLEVRRYRQLELPRLEERLERALEELEA